MSGGVRPEGGATDYANAQLLNLLVNGIVDYAVFMIDGEGRVATWNAGAQSIKGYASDEILGQNYEVFFPPEARMAGTPGQILAIARREGRFEGEGWRLRKDGGRFLAHVTIDTIREESGAIAGFAKVTRDITEKRRGEALARQAEQQRLMAEERERAAAALRKTSETLNAVIEASPFGITMINSAGIFELWNSACERIYGVPAQDVLGKSWAAVVDRTWAVGASSVDGSRPSPPTGQGGESVHRRIQHNGKITDLEITFAPIPRDGEDVAGHVCIINDVTERLLIEAQLRQAQKMEAIGQLTGGLAHDFNNLLSIVICNLELLLEDATPGSDARECAGMALDASLRGAELIQHMLAFARKQRLEASVVNVGELVENMTNMLKRSLGENIDITLEAEPSLWPSVVDAAQLQTALINLATNARDAMPEGGRLVIESRNTSLDEDYAARFPDVKAGDYVLVSVSDSGKGMAPEVVARAFDPFYTTKSASRGTGLGLSMVFGFVKQSSGHIRIYSEPGQGATVKLYLPRARGEASEAAVAARPAETTAGHGEIILVVEDNVDLAISVEATLRRAGFLPLMANDAIAALHILDGPARIDLLFTDIILARGMNGIELAREAERRRPGLKILFTSGFAEGALTAGGMTMTVNRLVSKPYLKAELLAKIVSVLGAPEES